MNTSEQKTLKLSDYPETKEGDVKFVTDVFTKEVGRHNKRTIVGGAKNIFLR